MTAVPTIPQRLLPFSLGISLSLLLLGLITNPLFAQSSPCMSCQNFYYNLCKSKQPLQGETTGCEHIDPKSNHGYGANMLDHCCRTYAKNKCYGPSPNDGNKYPCPDSGQTYEGKNCDSEYCSILACNGAGKFRNGSACLNFCNNCEVDGSATSNGCNQLRNNEAFRWVDDNQPFLLPSNCLSYCGCGNP
jgi:hypothetical protein